MIFVFFFLCTSFKLLLLLVTVGNVSRDRNTNKQRCTLPMVNLVVITHEVLRIAKPPLCPTVSLLEISKNLD